MIKILFLIYHKFNFFYYWYIYNILIFLIFNRDYKLYMKKIILLFI